MTCDMSAIALARGMSGVLSLSFNALICSKRISLRSLMVFLFVVFVMFVQAPYKACADED